MYFQIWIATHWMRSDPMGNCLSNCFGTACTDQNGHHGAALSKSTTTAAATGSKPVTFTPIHTIASVNADRPTSVTTHITRLPPTSATRAAPPYHIDGVPAQTVPRNYSAGPAAAVVTTREKSMFGAKSQSTAGASAAKRNSWDTHARRISFTSKEPSETKIIVLYEQYKDADEDAILAEGVEQFCKDLNVRPEEFRVLVLAWKFNAETMCRFTRSEFIGGCKRLKADSIKTIQSRFNDMLKEVKSMDAFKEFYRWTYRFGLDSDQGQRTLPTDIAISLWRLVFTQREPPLLERWLVFLESHPEIKGIPRDTWDMFLHFVEQVGADLSNYDDTEAWPSLLDDFVEHENDRQNQNVVHKMHCAAAGAGEEFW